MLQNSNNSNNYNNLSDNIIEIETPFSIIKKYLIHLKWRNR